MGGWLSEGDSCVPRSYLELVRTSARCPTWPTHPPPCALQPERTLAKCPTRVRSSQRPCGCTRSHPSSSAGGRRQYCSRQGSAQVHPLPAGGCHTAMWGCLVSAHGSAAALWHSSLPNCLFPLPARRALRDDVLSAVCLPTCLPDSAAPHRQTSPGRALSDDVLPPGLNGDPNGYPIGKGADLFISMWNLHR